MTEVCFCGGGTAHGEKINLCVLGCPLPTYIKEGGRRRPAKGELRQHNGVLMVMMKLPTQGFA